MGRRSTGFALRAAPVARVPRPSRRATQWPGGAPLPENNPVFGKDAFDTGTGVHANAVIKAKKKGEDWLADRVYQEYRQANSA